MLHSTVHARRYSFCVYNVAAGLYSSITVGTYSSVYVASPLTIIMNDALKKFGVELKDPALKAAKAKKDPNYAPPVIVKHRPKKT